MPHQTQRHDHLARKTAYQSGGEADESVGLDQLVQVDAQQFHRDAQVIAEVKVFRHLDDMVLLLVILHSG